MTRNNSEFGLAMIELALVGVGGALVAVDAVVGLPLPVVHWGCLVSCACACVAAIVGCVISWGAE